MAKTQSQERIRMACVALEEALTNFEKDDIEGRRRKQEQLSRLKAQLETIRNQLDELSR